MKKYRLNLFDLKLRQIFFRTSLLSVVNSAAIYIFRTLCLDQMFLETIYKAIGLFLWTISVAPWPYFNAFGGKKHPSKAVNMCLEY